MSRPRRTGFWQEGVDGVVEWRKLTNPDGAPTGRQLLKLNALGMLELVNPDNAKPLTKAEAAAAIDWLRSDG
jgi:hypothetical protein